MITRRRNIINKVDTVSDTTKAKISTTKLKMEETKNI